MTGSFISWRSLLMTAFTVSFLITFFVWVVGYLIPDEPVDFFVYGFAVVVHLFGLWLLVVLGVHSLARETLNQSDWQDLDALTRGQQVDLGLAIMKTLGDDDHKSRWLSGHAIAKRLGAKHALTVQALQKLHESNMVRASQAANRPDHWRLSTESLHGLNLQDLMEAFGATLDPAEGVYEEGPQQALLDLADQERRVFRTDLASLTRVDRSRALTSDAPAFLSLISDRGLGTKTDAAGAVSPTSKGSALKAYERLAALFEQNTAESEARTSQLTQNYPAFKRPPQQPIDKTSTTSDEDLPDPEHVLEKSENEEEDESKNTSPLMDRLNRLDNGDKARTDKAPESEEDSPSKKNDKAARPEGEESPDEEEEGDSKETAGREKHASAPSPLHKPVVSTGLTSLVKDKKTKSATKTESA